MLGEPPTCRGAVAVEPDAAPSRPLNLCFIINEGHTLPVLSLVTDEANKMEFIYRTGKTGQILSGTAGFFEPGGGGFTAACGVSMRGHTSLKLPKKSLGVDFTGFADGAVDYDLFGAGVQSIAGLSVRAGQDYSQATIRDELFQDLCLEAGNRALGAYSIYRDPHLPAVRPEQVVELAASSLELERQRIARLAGVPDVAGTVRERLHLGVVLRELAP